MKPTFSICLLILMFSSPIFAQGEPPPLLDAPSPPVQDTETAPGQKDGETAPDDDTPEAAPDENDSAAAPDTSPDEPKENDAAPLEDKTSPAEDAPPGLLEAPPAEGNISPARSTEPSADAQASPPASDGNSPAHEDTKGGLPPPLLDAPLVPEKPTTSGAPAPGLSPGSAAPSPSPSDALAPPSLLDGDQSDPQANAPDVSATGKGEAEGPGESKIPFMGPLLAVSGAVGGHVLGSLIAGSLYASLNVVVLVTANVFVELEPLAFGILAVGLPLAPLTWLGCVIAGTLAGTWFGSNSLTGYLASFGGLFLGLITGPLVFGLLGTLIGAGMGTYLSLISPNGQDIFGGDPFMNALLLIPAGMAEGAVLGSLASIGVMPFIGLAAGQVGAEIWLPQDVE